MDRYLKQQIIKDITKKMVLIGGPRQVGKTTLAKSVSVGKLAYHNWDILQDRDRILTGEIKQGETLIFDELHKYKSWRGFLKGLFDANPKQKIIVTGSAKLDYYRRGGDSLQGRYHYFRLNPLSVAELGINTQKEILDLIKLGGFPEPFFSSDEIDAKRWSREYRSRLVREDLATLEQIVDLDSVERLMIRLPALVGSPLSINGLTHDLEVSHKTLAKWLIVLERLYAIFRLAPFGAPHIKAVKKEQKHFHYDWTLIKENGPRFENMVALHLLKWVQYEQDTKARELDLRYFRDVDLREVDFVVTEDEKPILLVECKWSDDAITKGLHYLKQRFPKASAWQIAATGKKDYQTPDGIRVCPAVTFLRSLV